MKKLLILIAVIIAKAAICQTTTFSPAMTNTLGGSGDVNAIHYDFTVGEPVVLFGGTGCDSIFSGFQHCAVDSNIRKKTTVTANGAITFCLHDSVILSAPTAVGGSYLWSNNATTQSISATQSGTYHVRVTNTCGDTIGSNNIVVTTLNPPTPSICMVTVDSLGINNDIYWDKTLYTNVDSFIVYRYDIISTGYLRIGAVSKDSLSMFTDTERSIGGPNGGDPQYSSYQYKLATRDTCGNLSALSPYHQSIFVQQPGNGSSFSWNAYTIEGSPSVSGYQFMRNDTGTGTWNVLVNTSGTATTDPNYASYPNGKWRVQALGLSCNPTRQLISTTRSNIRHNVIVTGISNNENGIIQIYPNPANESVTIEISGQIGTTTIKIVNILGQLMEDEIVLPPSSAKTLRQIDVKNYTKGIYTVSIENNGVKRFKKLVVN